MTQENEPILSFGVIADPQYADRDPRLEFDRHYRESLGKLDEAVDLFNQLELSFVVTLGDIIDKDWESFDAALARYQPLRHRTIFLPGNHDFAVKEAELLSVYQRLGMPAPYYSFVEQGLRFIILDGNEKSIFARPKGDALREEAKIVLNRLEGEGAINGYRWNADIGEAQFNWLSGELDAAKAAGERVIIFCHYPIYPVNSHNLWEYQRLCDLIEPQSHVIAWMNGHNHDGNYGLLGACHCVNFKGMVDTKAQNTYAKVSIFKDSIVIDGYGREISRKLTIAS